MNIVYYINILLICRIQTYIYKYVVLIHIFHTFFLRMVINSIFSNYYKTKQIILDIKYFKRVRRGLIEITRSKPKAVVINLDMQDGLQACLEVKDSPLLKETKVLALTTTRSNNSIFNLIFSNTPADYFLSTPIESSYLQELLENIYQTSLPTALFQRSELLHQIFSR